MKKKMNSFVKVHGNGHARCVAQSISDSWEKSNLGESKQIIQLIKP
jgi:hypothetical protein